MVIDDLQQKIKKYAKNPVEGREWYYTYENLITVISIILEKNHNILGLEGFDCSNGNIIPDMDAILNNSGGNVKSFKQNYQNFLQTVNNKEHKLWTIVYSK